MREVADEDGEEEELRGMTMRSRSRGRVHAEAEATTAMTTNTVPTPKTYGRAQAVVDVASEDANEARAPLLTTLSPKKVRVVAANTRPAAQTRVKRKKPAVAGESAKEGARGARASSRPNAPRRR